MVSKISWGTLTTGNKTLRIIEGHDMNITVTQQGDISIAAIGINHLDVRSVDEFKSELLQMVNDQKKVVLDCEQVYMVDSSGLGAIINVAQSLRSKGGVLKIAAVSKGVSALFELVRMQRIVGVYGTVDEAVNSF